ncbi:MAG TPA: PHP domain-containing protein [Gammaproteobacteria bacterium]|nr:PHP domain-containing protein [Gammaproteobacteria bacterium]
MIYDLHSHSTASDGELAPGQLVRRARARGVDVLALTDHDTLEGLSEARTAASELGLVLVAGVEISVTWEGRLIHVVGLGVDPQTPSLQAGLATLRDIRRRRAVEIGRRLAALDIEGAYEGALALARGKVVSRSHFARHLLSRGYGRDFKGVFKRYLGRGCPAYVPCRWAALGEAVRWIREAGGQAVVAHPARYRMGRRLLQAFLEDFTAAGGCGIEVSSSSHTPGECREMARWAARFGLYASAGSDFHGIGKGWAELGRMPPLPAECTPIWQDWPLPLPMEA